MLLSICLIFFQFQRGNAYKSVAFKKRVYALRQITWIDISQKIYLLNLNDVATHVVSDLEKKMESMKKNFRDLNWNST